MKQLAELWEILKDAESPKGMPAARLSTWFRMTEELYWNLTQPVKRVKIIKLNIAEAHEQ